MTEMILYDYFRSSASYRIRIALNLKGVEYRSISVSLLAGEQKTQDYRDKNPQGFVPTLVVDDLHLTQSLAIIDWLDHRYPDPPLVPSTQPARALALAQAQIIAVDTHPLNNMRILVYLKRMLGFGDRIVNRWIAQWVTEGLAALEALAANGSGDYLGGDAPNIADICLVPQLYNARRYNVPLDDFPRLVAVDKACAKLDAFQRAHPDVVNPTPQANAK